MAQDPLTDAGPDQSRDAAPSLVSHLLPKPQRASDRRVGTAPAARNLRREAGEAESHTAGSRLLGWAIPILASLERGPCHRQAGHGDPLASQRLPALLAMDLEARSLAATHIGGSTSPHQSLRAGEWLGRAESPCRASKVWERFSVFTHAISTSPESRALRNQDIADGMSMKPRRFRKRHRPSSRTSSSRWRPIIESEGCPSSLR